MLLRKALVQNNSYISYDLYETLRGIYMKIFFTVLLIPLINISITAQVHTITATTNANGSISPSGLVNVNEGADQNFIITPYFGYKIADVLVDNVSVGAVPNYNFTNVITDHTISVTFINIDIEQIVTGISGEIEIVDMPSNLNGGQFTSQTHIRLMFEGAGTVTDGMPDFLYDGAYHDPNLGIPPGIDNTFGNAITTPYSGPGLPAVGTEVYSVFMHFDPDLSGVPFNLNEGIGLTGTITFDRPILGVYVTSGALNTTDNIFTPSGVTFSSSIGRDMEFNYDGDQYSISQDRYELSLTMFCHNGGVLDEMRIILETNPTVDVNAKVFLEGPYTGSNSMSTILNSELPTTQPYASLLWNYYGSESVVSGFFTTHTDIVDWILMELRSSPTTVVSARTAFIKSNGDIVDLDGNSPVKFNAVPAEYYIAVKHRNHLAVMSHGPISLSEGSSTFYDFTTDQTKAYGTDPMVDLGDGNYGMIGGDANGDRHVTTLDYDVWLPDARSSATGYNNTDMNLDGQTTTLDYDVWLPNARSAEGSQVP